MDAPTISQYDRDHVQGILHGHGDWFSAHLLRLIAHADAENRERIRLVFPHHVAAFEDWHSGRRPSLPVGFDREPD